MKKLLLALIIFLPAIGGAQILSFTDPAFKHFLVHAGEPGLPNGANDINNNPIMIDANGDNEIQASEAALVWSLYIYNDENITSVEGIEAFTNLRYLSISYNPIVSLDVSELSYLEELGCGCSALTSLNTSGLENLRTISITGSLSSIDLTDKEALEWLELYNNQITSLDVSGAPNLEQLRCASNIFTSLDVSGLEHLEFLDCSDNAALTSLTLGDHNSLYTANISATSITAIDASGCVAMGHLYANDTQQLSQINVKNGSIVTVVQLNGSTGQKYLCVDEGEIEEYTTTFFDNPLIQIGTYCSFTPQGQYNTINGSISFDMANNGCISGNTSAYYNGVIINDGGEDSSALITSTGDYVWFTTQGDFTVTPQINDNLFTVSPSSATVSFSDIDNNISTQNFCLTANGVHPDIEVVLVPVIAAQPGFDAAYQIVYKNKGNQVLSGNVTFSYDDGVLDYVSATPVETTAASGSLVWAYTNLEPFESRGIDLVLNVNGPMETPAVEIGHELLFDVAVTPLSGDETPQDNNFGYKQTVVGSFDPNDITCLEGAFATPDKIGDYLHYNINFENTGNATATFIVVKDVIDEAQFDVSSLQLLNASHDVQVRVEGNTVEFFFDGIDLGAQEKGNVVFKIKTLNTLQVNDDVTQQANIFFDYNWPIETNEATTIFQVLGTERFIMDESVNIYPNPAVSLINIKASSAINSVQLYDMQGRVLQSVLFNDTNAMLDITDRASGMYVLKVTTDLGVKAEKIFKK